MYQKSLWGEAFKGDALIATVVTSPPVSSTISSIKALILTPPSVGQVVVVPFSSPGDREELSPSPVSLLLMTEVLVPSSGR